MCCPRPSTQTGASYRQAICLVDQADRKITANIPSDAYTAGHTAGKVYSLCADDGHDSINVHSSYLECVDELCDRKRHWLL